MLLTTTTKDDCLVASVEGVLDESAADIFRAELHPHTGNPGGKLVLDLSKCSRINSRGIASVVLLATDANTNDARVILAALTPFITNVLQVTRLNTFLEIADTVEDAIRILNNS